MESSAARQESARWPLFDVHTQRVGAGPDSINPRRGIVMKSSIRLIPAVAAILLAAALTPLANAEGDRIATTIGGVSYISGGVGEASRNRLLALSADFNLKLVFALQAGDYLSGIKVTIADAAGKTLLDITSDGPFLLAKLHPGTYRIAASFNGRVETRDVAVGAEKLNTIDFRWAS